MTVSLTLQKYLDQSVTYDLIPHAPTLSSTRTAEACHVPGEALAKAVILRRDGGYMMAVLPASHHLHLSALKSQLGHHVIGGIGDFDRRGITQLQVLEGTAIDIDGGLDAQVDLTGIFVNVVALRVVSVRRAGFTGLRRLQG